MFDSKRNEAFALSQLPVLAGDDDHEDISFVLT
jgi:hypothetical protein